MNRRALVLLAAAFGLMAMTAWFSNTVWFRQVIHSDTQLTRNLPSVIGAWRLVEEAAPTESEYRGLETRDIVKRTYSDGRSMVELVLAHIAHSSRKSAHAQESCLRGSGALVGNIYRKKLAGAPVDATVISIDSRNRKSLVNYWYKIGDIYTSDYFRSSLLMFMGGMVGRQSQGASLIRLLSPVASGETEASVQARLENFTEALVPALELTLP